MGGKNLKGFPFCVLVGKGCMVNCGYTTVINEWDPSPFPWTCLVCSRHFCNSRECCELHTYTVVLCHKTSRPPRRGLESWGSFVSGPTWGQRPAIAFCFPIEYITYFKLCVFITHSLSWPYLQMGWVKFSAFSQNLHGLSLKRSPCLAGRYFLLQTVSPPSTTIWVCFHTGASCSTAVYRWSEWSR